MVQVKYDLLYDGTTSPRSGTWGIGEWEKFSIASEDDCYKLGIGKRVKIQNMGSHDPFKYHNEMNFTTTDRDNNDWDDKRDSRNCAVEFGGGWWHKNCFNVCLNCQRTGKSIWEHEYGNWQILSHSYMWIKQVA